MKVKKEEREEGRTNGDIDMLIYPILREKGPLTEKQIVSILASRDLAYAVVDDKKMALSTEAIKKVLSYNKQFNQNHRGEWDTT